MHRAWPAIGGARGETRVEFHRLSITGVLANMGPHRIAASPVDPLLVYDGRSLRDTGTGCFAVLFVVTVRGW